ncbi:MAG TPA: prepilin-type N-terminal cleavage/methylation domain-containing protein, partial [Blastocatellia bacterium]|nr:prepilin-type N-terminal cleavage/methylation domain-containing protein [Blastocatellia bacterium]
MKLEKRLAGAARDLGERGFSLTELMIAMMVFTVVVGSVFALLAKSQTIFRTEQGVSEMDQNARLLIDFITRDIQQAKENGLGLGSDFRSIYSYNGPEGKTDEIIIVSSDTETEIPPAGLPLVPALATEFSVANRFIEAVPNGAGHLDAAEVATRIKPDEEFIVSAVTQGGSVQFDFIKVKSVKITHKRTIGIDFEPVEHRGVEPEIPFGSVYEGGSLSMRPVAIKRYFIDRKTDKEHPALALSINDSAPITIARNVVAFQLRYLEQKKGEIEGVWVKQQNISREYRTLAVEVTMTARTEIAGDREAERLV